MESAASSDKAMGLAVAFGVLGLLSALTMYTAAVNHEQVLSGAAFAGALLAGGVAIAALHLFE